ncbi:MAG: hypothetical protein AAB372_02675 [Patescibacteria group bacterium]
MPKVLVVFLVLVGIAIIITIALFFLWPAKPDTKVDQSASTQSTTEDVPITLYRSENGGEGWVPVPAARGLDILAFEWRAGHQNQFYIGTRGQGLFRSDDGGKTLTQVKDPKNVLRPDSSVYAIAQSSDGTELILAVFQEGFGRLIRLREIGAQELYHVPLENYGLFGVVVDQKDSRHIVAVSGEGNVLETVDGGQTWEVIAHTKDGIVKLLASSGTRGRLWGIGEQNTFFRSTTYGRLWNAISDISLDEKGSVGKLYDVREHTARRALLAGSDYGVIESHDNGETWDGFITPVPPSTRAVEAVEGHPRFSEIFWWAAGNEVFRTEDGGITWRMSTLPVAGKIILLRSEENNPKILYAGLSR